MCLLERRQGTDDSRWYIQAAEEGNALHTHHCPYVAKGECGYEGGFEGKKMLKEHLLIHEFIKDRLCARIKDSGSTKTYFPPCLRGKITSGANTLMTPCRRKRPIENCNETFDQIQELQHPSEIESRDPWREIQ